MSSSPIPHKGLPYIHYGTSIYTPNTTANALLDAALQDSHLASTLCYGMRGTYTFFPIFLLCQPLSLLALTI